MRVTDEVTPPTVSIVEQLAEIEEKVPEPEDSDSEDYYNNPETPAPAPRLNKPAPSPYKSSMSSQIGNEKEEFKAIPMYRGKSSLLGSEVLTSIDNMKHQFRWDDNTTIRRLGSKLKGTKLKEWLLRIQQIPDTEDKWEAVKSAFERKFIKISHTKRWEKIKKLKQAKNESLEVYRGRLEELVAPVGMVDKEKVNLFIIGLRKHYRRRIHFYSRFNTIADVVFELTEEEDFGSSSDKEDESSEESSSSSSDELSSSSSSDEERKSRKKSKKKKIFKKKKSLKKKKRKEEDPIQRQLKELQKKMDNLTTRSSSVFAIQEVPNNVNANQNNSRNMYQDMRTTTGIDICGRCQRMGHKHVECPRKAMQCRRCQRLGHISPECRVMPSNPPRSNGNMSFNNTNRGPMNQSYNNSNRMNQRSFPTCYRCGQPGHLSTMCNQRVNNNVNNSSSATHRGAPRFEEVPPLNK